MKSLLFSHLAVFCIVFACISSQSISEEFLLSKLKGAEIGVPVEPVGLCGLCETSTNSTLCFNEAFGGLANNDCDFRGCVDGDVEAPNDGCGGGWLWKNRTFKESAITSPLPQLQYVKVLNPGKLCKVQIVCEPGDFIPLVECTEGAPKLKNPAGNIVQVARKGKCGAGVAQTNPGCQKCSNGGMDLINPDFTTVNDHVCFGCPRL